MTGPQFVPPRLVSVPMAAQELGISATALWQMVWHGDVPSILLGHRRLIARATIDRICADPGVVSAPPKQVRRAGR